jgi:hypothetical protein
MPRDTKAGAAAKKNGAPTGTPVPARTGSVRQFDSCASAAFNVALGRIAWPTLVMSGW